MTLAMRLLVVNGDDFGLSAGVTEGILEAHINGVLTSTSLMVLAPAAREGAEAAAAHPKLSVGLHFTEDPDVDLDDSDQVRTAFERQLERFRGLLGRDPTHVDSHHHVHAEPDRMPIFRALVEPLGVPLRKDGRVAYIGGFYAQWEPGVSNLDYVRRPFLRHLVDTEVGDGFTELACHPARITGDFRSSYLSERAVELATLTEPGLREELEGSGVTMVSYHDWPRGPGAATARARA
ncbi:MAG: ChbG/HpnK family deacetylase [Solirubrobacterales bacterium]|nr:ChbG/HpnK family deacetylase [Solirubrobacterales bacterium]